jgi:hypothetical protein
MAEKEHSPNSIPCVGGGPLDGTYINAHDHDGESKEYLCVQSSRPRWVHVYRNKMGTAWQYDAAGWAEAEL